MILAVAEEARADRARTASRPAPLLEVRNLHTAFAGAAGLDPRRRRRQLLARPSGETKGLVGESGSGKSVTLLSLLGLVPEPGRVIDGEVLLGRPRPARLSRRRAAGDPRPRDRDDLPGPDELPEPGLHDRRADRRDAAGEARDEAAARRATRAVELLDHVGIPAARTRLGSYPHELCGGMRQRVMIAIAIACRPRLLLADEPTTALDVTIQDQILALLAELQDEFGMAMILVSHDLGVVAQNCDSVAVMYAGHVVEDAPGARRSSARRATRTRSRC